MTQVVEKREETFFSKVVIVKMGRQETGGRRQNVE
jgi:hypothetical protein